MNRLILVPLLLLTLPLGAQASQSAVTFDVSPEASEYGTLRIEGPAAVQIFKHLKVEEVDGIKRTAGITCVLPGVTHNALAYCSSSIESSGIVEGDGISPVDPHPSVSGSNRGN